ncbi:MAG: winged helix-turn-helix transcriptional regulator [Pseudomonadales bacterium]|nr:winged helix-turn-helix transcriptional regulator [Pseudomonadales bacterium]MCP5213766.1 winged helix-turn-helix transcriptional regulator [Pseudomonadales bacterium]
MKTNQIYDYVERLSELLRVDARQKGAEHGLLPVQLEVLHYLSICNQYSDTPMAVTEYLGQTKGTVSQTLKVLENKALLVKVSDEKDKRTTHLSLSPKGRRLVNEIIPTPKFVRACEALPEATQETIIISLNQLLSSILSANGMKTFGVCHSCRHNRKTKDKDFYCDLVKQPLSVDEVQLICREHEEVMTA